MKWRYQMRLLYLQLSLIRLRQLINQNTFVREDELVRMWDKRFLLLDIDSNTQIYRLQYTYLV